MFHVRHVLLWNREVINMYDHVWIWLIVLYTCWVIWIVGSHICCMIIQSWINFSMNARYEHIHLQYFISMLLSYTGFTYVCARKPVVKFVEYNNSAHLVDPCACASVVRRKIRCIKLYPRLKVNLKTDGKFRSHQSFCINKIWG